jgi:IS1 family transposase
MANVLPREKQLQVLGALVEGNSIRSTERMTGVMKRTITSLLTRVGTGCDRLLDERMRNLDCKRFELDEIWSFVAKKQRHIAPDDPSDFGDTWVYVALDAETKLVPTYFVGKRGARETYLFVSDLAARLRNRIQVSTDGLKLYVEAIEESFGADVDYGQIVKEFEVEPIGPGRYSPPKVSSVEKTVIAGKPDEKLISTSYVERQNLTMRMRMRRFTRLTNGFSKKLDNHKAAVALHFAHYNFVAVHGTLRVTPAMAAGVTDKLWSMDDLLDAASA